MNESRTVTLGGLITAAALACCVGCAASSARPAMSPEAAASPPIQSAEKLRIIAFGAHPDDCEIKAGGVGALWAA